MIPEDAPIQGILGEELIRVRNAVFHREFARAGRASMLQTIQRCSEFLAWWAQRNR
jgi:hypothetical protein